VRRQRAESIAVSFGISGSLLGLVLDAAWEQIKTTKPSRNTS